MKESENVSLFIASFYEKKFLKLYFSAEFNLQMQQNSD